YGHADGSRHRLADAERDGGGAGDRDDLADAFAHAEPERDRHRDANRYRDAVPDGDDDAAPRADAHGDAGGGRGFGAAGARVLGDVERSGRLPPAVDRRGRVDRSARLRLDLLGDATALQLARLRLRPTSCMAPKLDSFATCSPTQGIDAGN